LLNGNRRDYEARGMDPFRPHPGKPHVSLSYYEVPSEVLEDRDECALWTRRSVAVASVTTKKEGKLLFFGEFIESVAPMV
jgi:TfoX/Sxy family transcriptional regulator of competence genes